MLIAQATKADCRDLQRCARLAYQQYVQAIGREPAPMRADFVSLLDRGVVDVARIDDELVGFIVLFKTVLNDSDACLFVENIAVIPEMAGRNIGTRLMQHAQSVAIAQSLPCIRLYTNVKMTRNLDWYPKLGFVETSRVEEDGFNRVYFEKQLTGNEQARTAKLKP